MSSADEPKFPLRTLSVYGADFDLRFIYNLERTYIYTEYVLDSVALYFDCF